MRFEMILLSKEFNIIWTVLFSKWAFKCFFFAKKSPFFVMSACKIRSKFQNNATFLLIDIYSIFRADMMEKGDFLADFVTKKFFFVSSALDCSLYRWHLFVYFTFPST